MALNKDENTEFNWNDIFDENNEYNMLYALQIIDSLIKGNLKAIQSEDMADLQSDWVQRFLR
jgi:hypothetical protein